VSRDRLAAQFRGRGGEDRDAAHPAVRGRGLSRRFPRRSGVRSGKNLYPKEAYVLKNNIEFFAVTASIFLAGKDATHEPNTRAQLK